ncbi:hypothetical protein DK412_11125 [Methylobacterium sp. 17Sr1-1]|nr:hypothetical protein DK412_11125 [Methylobacterium sp. 17Sr1-1]
MVLGWEPPGFLVGNDAASALTGVDPSDLIGSRLAEVWPELVEHAADPLGAALAGRATELSGVTLWPARTRLDLACSPLVDEGDGPAGMLIILREASPATSQMSDRDQAGVSELRRQIRNTLGVTRAVVRRSIQTSDTLEDLALHLDGRLDAIARVQSIFSSASAADADLSLVVAEELLALQIREDERVTLTGPDIRLPQRLGERLGLAIHELATNAIKYGALAMPSGRIAISWRVDEAIARRLVLTWKESGGLTQVGAPRRSGFGSELLLKTLPYEIKAEVSWDVEPTGLRCVIALPLGAAQARSASAT